MLFGHCRTFYIHRWMLNDSNFNHVVLFEDLREGAGMKNESEILIYQNPDGEIRLDVRLEDETV